MKNTNKQVLIGTALSGLLLLGGVQAAKSDVKYHPLTVETMGAINNAKDAKEAQELLCRQKGIYRGSGLSAGNKCKLQDAARLIAVICGNFEGFWDSNCGKNIKKDTDPKVAHRYIKNAIKDNFPNTVVYCDLPREKLPGDLMAIANEACPAPTITPTTAAPTPVAPPSTPARPRAKAVSGVTAAALQARPAVVIVQGALKDLPARESLEVENLQGGEFFLEAAKTAMREYEEKEKLVGAEKVTQPGITQKVPPALLEKVGNLDKQADLSLLKIKTEVEEKKVKTISKDLLQAAQDHNKAMQELKKELSPYMDVKKIEEQAKTAAAS